VTLEERILARHNTTRGEWAVFTELANGTGGNYGRAIDVAAFNLWPSKHFYRVAYEVKRSRGDFLRELAQPDKRHWVEQIFHETWFVFGDKTIAAVDEIPDGWGLMVASRETRLRRLRVARVREVPNELPASVTLAVLRRAQALSESGSRHVRLAGRRVTLDELDELVDESTEINLGWERSRLETATKNREAQRERLRGRQNDLEAPLATLCREIGRHFGTGYECPTEGDVLAWLAQARTGIDSRASRFAREAQAAIERLVEVVK
jgi:hypothetical protein